PDDALVQLVRSATGSANTFAEAGATTDTPGGAASAPEIPVELADHPRYRVLGLLGRGGMGAVYRAEHRLMGRQVALKVPGKGLTDTPEVVERFRREIQAAAQLAHPNIVTAHDAEEAGGVHFLVMELVDGVSLEQLVQDTGPQSIADACGWIQQAALALQH